MQSVHSNSTPSLTFALPIPLPHGTRHNPTLVRTPHHPPLQICPRRQRRPAATWTATAAAAQPDPRSNARSPDESREATGVPPPPPDPDASAHCWERLNGCDLVTSGTGERPVAVLLFTGGLGAGVAPRALYGRFLGEVARRGNVAVLAAPLPPSFDHRALALDVADRMGDAVRELMVRWDVPWMPVFGMGHSLGAKLLAISCSDEEMRGMVGPVVANVFVSFNNYTAGQSVPILDVPLLDGIADRSARGLGKAGDFLQGLKLGDVLGPNSGVAEDVLRKVGSTFSTISDGLTGGEFTPGPSETLELIGRKYNVRDNLLITFSRDSLDQSDALRSILQKRFGERGCVSRRLDGTHVTPLTPSFGEEDGVDGFSGVGSEAVDRELRKVATTVSAEVDAVVAVVVAFLRLHLEVLAARRMLK